MVKFLVIILFVQFFVLFKFNIILKCVNSLALLNVSKQLNVITLKHLLFFILYFLYNLLFSSLSIVN